MLILLSPAKKLDFTKRGHAPTATRPALMDRTKELSKTTAKLSASEIKSLMHLSDDLADLNRERFKAFDPESTEGRPAAMAFNGEVYSGLDAPSLSPEDLQWAQQRLRILSGLYGALRPLDTIQPYRLEMGTRLKTPKGGNLYDFWGEDIADLLKSDLEGHPSKTVINLASNEYSKAAKLKSLGVPVISVDFKEEKDGQLRALMVYAKKARGMMARWIIENRIEDPKKLPEFNVDGYRFDADGSTESTLLFTRPQPPKKS
ncbi:peroxide stress protein YaaA [Oceanicaulis alexandrii]|uniref:peroxide stress protein YaaA n=1 Tax=Oceanicaulis alexandrii TaxID=153233 RepID=UPI00235601CE|nr:peroxide stress protein YaaA [Oceanicaulis alexandrii]